MLDSQMLEQLKSLFAPLESEIEFVSLTSSHSNQSELNDFLSSLITSSPKLKWTRSQKISDVPEFSMKKNGKDTGVSFLGIPGGHEFSSLILAILNVDEKGKRPDLGIQKRIQNIKGPVRLRTFISLTCENCPEVVQAFNLMAFLHKDFHHQMVDGGYAQSEIDRLGIQGVPSVILNDKMIHSGKGSLIQLIEVLEKELGSEKSNSTINENLGLYDVAVLGGGPAGVSAAIYSARKGLKTVLIAEKMGGQVQDTKGIENMISMVYTEGPQLTAQLNQHLSQYPVQVLEHRRVKSVDTTKKFITLESGETLTAGTIIVTTGAKWRELNVPGEKQYLGRGVAYCPHCDGPYYKGKKVAVVGGGNSGVEAAIDLSGIVSEVVVFEYNKTLKADQILIDKLNSIKNIRVVTSAQTSEVVGDGGKVTSLVYKNRETEKLETENLDGIFVQIGLVPNSQFLKDALELSKYGEIIVDNKGRTSVPGIYAAGDVTTTPFKQIIIAMGEGAKVALAAFEDKMYASVS